MKGKLIVVSLIFILIPVTVNYLLFTWRAPNVFGSASDWLGFFANYFGLIGAVSIALYQIHNQKKNEIERDKIDHRSFLVVNKIHSRYGLKNINTSENSRLIETAEYLQFQNNVPRNNHDHYTISYLLIAQYGNSEIIFK